MDLDAAFGRGHNRAVLADIVGDLDIDVELSGGIRDDESLQAALRTGCRRVNLSPAAVDEPAWCAIAIVQRRPPDRRRARRPGPHTRRAWRDRTTVATCST